MVVLFLLFCRFSILFSIKAESIFISTNSISGFPFLHILINGLLLSSLTIAILAGVRWYYVFDLPFFWWLMILSSFSNIPLDICMSPVRKKVYCSFLIFIWIISSIELPSYLQILNISPLSDIWFANIFFHSIICLFSFWIFSLLCRNFLACCSFICLFFAFVSYAFHVR